MKASNEMQEDQLCENGCGLPASHYMKSKAGGYWCCSSHYRQCPVKAKEAEEKRKATVMAKYGAEHYTQSLDFSQKVIETTVAKYGVTHAMKSPEIVEKRKASEIEAHGDLKTGYKTRKKRLLEEHGVENIAQVPGVAEKVQETIQSKFGSHYSKNSGWRERYKLKTGYEHPRLNPLVEAKRVKTLVYMNGVASSFEIEDIRNRAKATRKEKYGVEFSFQRPKIYHDAVITKPYTMPSGKVVKVRGYEGLILDELLAEDVAEGDIEIGFGVPSFTYEWEGVKKIYYPNILIKSKNLIIDVKSVYEFHRAWDEHHYRRTIVEGKGYGLEFRVKYPLDLTNTAIV